MGPDSLQPTTFNKGMRSVLSPTVALGRGIALVLIILLPALVPVLAEEDQTNRPWAGILPDPDGASHDDKWFVTRIRDAETLAPIQGARWTRTPERIAPWRLRHDEVIAAGLSDAEGIAYLPTTKEVWADDCHWIVRAPGYAPAYEYATSPSAEVMLERGVSIRGQVLDALGRPVAGALLEYLGGCSHGTPLIRTRTGTDGTFTLSPVDTGAEGQLWVAGPGIAPGLFALDCFDTLGTRGIQIVLAAGRRYTGQIVDLEGNPIPGTVVRSYGGQRGPTAMCDADGRFVIDGVAEDGSLTFFSTSDLLDSSSKRHTDAVLPGIPFRLVLSAVGLQWPAAPCRVRVHAADAKGVTQDDIAYHLVHTDTGIAYWGTTAEGSDEDEAERVPPGTYRIIPDGRFTPMTFAPTELRTTVERLTQVSVRLSAQPMLSIRGEIPEDAELTLAVPGANISGDGSGAGWRPHLPANEPAVLRVECDHRPAFFFPVGNTIDGVRTVQVALPRQRRITLPVGGSEYELIDGPLRAAGHLTSGAFLTDAAGELVLRYRGADGHMRDIQLEVPGEPGVVVQADESRAREHPPDVRVTALKPGEPRPEDEDAWAYAALGARPRFAEPGWRVMRDPVTKAPETILRWGTCGLRLRLQDLRPLLLMIDGEVYEPTELIFELKGFDPGVVRVVVAPRGQLGAGLTFDVTLRADTVTKRDVVFEYD